MGAPSHRKYNNHDDPLLAKSRHKRFRHRIIIFIGVFLLLSGYALLAVNPNTPTEWVLIRVAAGFGLLFIGFGLAIMPWLTRVLGDDE